jgi:hypothetical protein
MWMREVTATDEALRIAERELTLTRIMNARA